MTPTTRKQLMASVALAAIAVAIMTALAARRMPRVGGAVGTFLTMVTLEADARMQEDLELPRACEVVVEQDLRGALMVSGTALETPVRAASRKELRQILRGIQGRGSAIARVAEPTKPNTIRLGSRPHSPEARRAHAELVALLVAEGFSIARVPGRRLTALPGRREIEAHEGH